MERSRGEGAKRGDAINRSLWSKKGTYKLHSHLSLRSSAEIWIYVHIYVCQCERHMMIGMVGRKHILNIHAHHNCCLTRVWYGTIPYQMR